MTEGILFSQMTPRSEEVDRFNSWYDDDHIPARLVLPGFQRATRYGPLPGEDEFLAVYEVDSLDAFATAGYLDLKRDPSDETTYMLGRVSGFTRYLCELLSDTGDVSGAQYLSAVAFAVPEEDRAEFEHWYADEHVPMLMAAPDWLRVRRYHVVDGQGGPWTHIALHELASLEVMDSPERERARSGPLRAQLADREWFGRSGRWLYRSLGVRTLESLTTPVIAGE
ncbi:hypothetical protein QWJ90_02355 [Microbacterium oryzae]|uniref:DUF4286 family protein n=1 Tax=Microbacterium oryzae TaxID=743009 RepID=UPI0025B23520|nr:DUF4286 family protein [Microbacterium oryzae]MDN3309767.1 hypothetical protein [Microbacterium oryzae]